MGRSKVILFGVARVLFVCFVIPLSTALAQNDLDAEIARFSNYIEEIAEEAADVYLESDILFDDDQMKRVLRRDWVFEKDFVPEDEASEKKQLRRAGDKMHDNLKKLLQSHYEKLIEIAKNNKDEPGLRKEVRERVKRVRSAQKIVPLPGFYRVTITSGRNEASAEYKVKVEEVSGETKVLVERDTPEANLQRSQGELSWDADLIRWEGTITHWFKDMGGKPLQGEFLLIPICGTRFASKQPWFTTRNWKTKEEEAKGNWVWAKKLPPEPPVAIQPFNAAKQKEAGLLLGQP